MASNKGDQITSLKKRISKIDVEIEEIKAEQRRQSTQINSLMTERQKLNDMVESLIPKKLIVSDHAILRYIERIMGIDVDSIRNTIANDKVQELVNTLGDAKVPIGDGAYAVVKNHSIVTIETADMAIKKMTGGKRAPKDRSSRYEGDDSDLMHSTDE